MFSTNQILEISGCIENIDELQNALTFALRASRDMELFTRTNNPIKCVYQITEDGRYCIGKAYNNIEEGWKEFSFDFDIEIISKIIEKHLGKQRIKEMYGDGGYGKGFIMKAIPESFMNEADGIKNPHYGIVVFAPYTCYYSK